MAGTYITKTTIARRQAWIAEIVTLSGSFNADATRVEAELVADFSRDGEQCLLDHLRLAGTIPEIYGHDSSEEKLYSKYTDALVAVAFRHIGLDSTVLSERADAADVECVAPGYSFVADAKAFRMSRTAKNQKDFKVEAMHGWKRGKPYAAVVCPSHHVPNTKSQIYQQAAASNVAILTYAHLAVMCRYATASGTVKAIDLLLNIFKAVKQMTPSQNAKAYWRVVNASMRDTDKSVTALWLEEQAATVEAIEVFRKEAVVALQNESVVIKAMTHQQAIAALLRSHNIAGRTAQAQKISDNGILRL